MLKKAGAVFTLGAFAVFSTSCVTWRPRKIRSAADHPREQVKVLSVVTAAGDTVRFSKAEPGLVSRGMIVGTATVIGTRDLEIEGPFRVIKRRADGTIADVVDGNGRGYAVLQVLSEGPTKMTIRIKDTRTESVSIPLADARLIGLRRTNTILTIAAIVATLGAGIVAYGIYIINHEL